jgi:DNA-binding beta-propeller fold protein YncE
MLAGRALSAGVALSAVLALMPPPPVGQPSSGGQALVSLSGEQRVVLISVGDGEVVATFPVSGGPHEIALSADRTRAFVANPEGGADGMPGRHVSVLDLRARATLANHKLESCPQPHEARPSEDGATLWVACAPAKAVAEIDAKTGALVRTFATPLDGGWFVVVTPGARRLFVPHLEGKGVTVIDRQTGSARVVLTGGAQSGIDVAPDGREAWVVDHERRRINIIGVAGDRVIGAIELESDEFGRLRFTADGRRVVLVQGTRFAVFDAARRREVASIRLALAGKVVAVSPGGDRAIVSHPADNQVSILQLSPLRVISSMAVGRRPDGVAWLE